MPFDRPSIAEQQARLAATAAEALDAWGWRQAELRLIKHRENAVFEAVLAGRRRALRLHRQGYHDDAELRSELQWMQALAAAGIEVPRLVPTLSGELFISREFAGLSGSLQVDLFEWIDGEPLGAVETGVGDGGRDVAQTYFSLGALAGRLHNQAAAWELPSGFRRHAWDLDGLVGERPFWGRFWELPALSRQERRLMERVRQRLRRELSALERAPANYGLIHADFVAENILVNGDQVRLIDFDDAGFGWHLFELATSTHFLMGESYFEAAQEALIRGYRSQRPLSDAQLARLPLFSLARATTYLGWVHTRPETETAQEMTPMLISSACELANAYLAQQGDRKG